MPHLAERKKRGGEAVWNTKKEPQGGNTGNMQNRCELCKADGMGMDGSEKKHAL
ncbi:MAG: hypothetical protein ACLTDX_06245 [[Clostridium] innocuum]